MLQELLDVVKVIWNMIESHPIFDKKKLEFLSQKRTSMDICSTRGGGGQNFEKNKDVLFESPLSVYLNYKFGLGLPSFYQQYQEQYHVNMQKIGLLLKSI